MFLQNNILMSYWNYKLDSTVIYICFISLKVALNLPFPARATTAKNWIYFKSAHVSTTFSKIYFPRLLINIFWYYNYITRPNFLNAHLYMFSYTVRQGKMSWLCCAWRHWCKESSVKGSKSVLLRTRRCGFAVTSTNQTTTKSVVCFLFCFIFDKVIQFCL